jgi:hypothetical protein
MNKEELRDTLQKLNIREDAYALDGGNLGETYTLAEAGGKWVFYYSERGNESGRTEFQTEADACDYFLTKILRDKSTRKTPAQSS